ncbi:hypothetical protein [Phenylobacterium sp.]|uniref:hypothetical protein n=1 Tax=Phenylobacterium sp. TaxID=1871053 RepID=UPI00403687B4
MSFLKLAGVTVSAAPLGYAKDYSGQFSAMDGLLSWHQPRLDDFDLDESNRLASWAAHAGLGDFAQPNAGDQPLVVEDFLNGHPVLQFNRANAEKLIWGGAFPTGASAQYSKIILLRPVGSGVTHNILASSTAANNRHILYLKSGGLYAHAVASIASGPQVDSADVATLDAWTLLIAGYDAATDTVSLQVNSGTKTTDVGAGDAAEATLFLGAPTDAASANTFGGYVADIWLFDDDLPADAERAADLALIREYCQARYGVSV